jgi:N6-adenosine-specific RNA methylase IME4
MFDIILADPPWTYNDQKSNDPKLGGITYNVMGLEDICKLPVGELANKDSLLFLWATMPKLLEALQVMESWGFHYTTTTFVWVKLNPTGVVEVQEKDIVLRGGVYSGLGHWANGNVEIALMGKRGKPKRKNKNVKQIVFAPRSGHSAKPSEVHSRIEQMVEGENRLELFARQRQPAWICIGNEITGNDITVDIDNLIRAGKVKENG